jgi:hypothetical protein
MIILTVLVSAFSVLYDLLDHDMDNQMFTFWYWFKLFLTNATAVLIILLSNSARKDSQMQRNERFTTLSTSLFELFKELNLKNLRTRFESYINADNARAKREAYEQYLNRKIAKIKSKIESLESNYNVEQLKKNQLIEAVPVTNKLIAVRAKLAIWKNRLKNIDNDVKFVNVKYVRVTYQSIFGTSETRLRESRDMSYHTAEHNAGIIIKKAILVFVIGFSASLQFRFTPFAWTVEFFYKLAVRLFQIGMALFTGISDADKFVAGEMCDALTNRIAYTQAFKETLQEKTGVGI